MADMLDLELRLGLGPRDAAPRSNGTAAEVARTGYGETSQHHVAQAMRAVSDDRDETEQPKSAAKVILQPPQLVEAGEEEEAATAEPESKRAKTEAPPANLDPPAVHQGDGGGATEPTWVRAELLPRHALPGDLQLHFVQEKVLTQSDLKSNKSRIFILSSGSDRLRPLLSAGELRSCGLHGSSRRRDRPAQGQDGAKKKKREDKTRHPGVLVLVYERGAEREAAALRLNSFWSTRAVVINGHGFGRFVAGSGFRKGDRVEFWAFRRPQDQHLCFVVA
uniref:Uncharacterized protein n=1 Tax=Setaria italica TaxID=4555 RepID=K4ALG2_SETIT